MAKFKLNYFNNELSPGFVALFSGRMIQFAANGLLGIFLPIFLLTKFNFSFSYVFFWYLIGNLIYVIALPLGAKILNKVGLRRSLRSSVFLWSAVLVCFFLIDYNVLFFSILAIIFLTLFRIAFWYPYHIDFIKFTKSNDRGKNVSMTWATQSFLGVIMPLIAGVLITNFGFNYVFLLVILIYMSSYIPFLALPRTKETFSWGYIETIKKFFKKKHRGLVLANMANGAESGVALIIWPIFIWQIFNGNFFAVGAMSSLIVLVTVILQLVVGKYTDIFSKRKMIHWGSVFYAIGWVAKIFVLTGYHVFLAGAYHSFAKIFKDTPFDALTYDLIADHGHYIDEFTVLKEMAVSLGRVLILVLAIVVAFNFGINWTFALAAFFSLFINAL